MAKCLSPCRDTRTSAQAARGDVRSQLARPGGTHAAHDVPRSCDLMSPAPTDRDQCGTSRASVQGVEFSRELRNDVLAGDITVSVRLCKRPQVKQGGRYRVGPGLIEVDAIELVPFAAITETDVRRAGEPDRETLRQRAAHAGPIDDDTLVYRIELHPVSPDD
jgi:hypothetical protein